MLSKLFSMLLCLPLLLCGCGEEEKKGDAKPKLVMVTSADFPPFEFFNTSEGAPQIVGFDIDLAKRIGTYLGYEIEIKDVDFSSIIPTLQSGRADFAMAGLTPSEERSKNVSFSQPYYFMNNVMVHRLDNDFMRRHDYEGIRIAVLLGSSTEQFAKTWAAAHAGVTLISLNRVGDAIQEVLAGRADGVILDETPAHAFVDKNNHQLTMQSLEGNSFGSAIAFHKDSHLVADFNRALAHLNEIGELDEIINKWLLKQ
jgi:arginine/lysine/histidine transporter system substrate-binding protein